MLEVGTRAINHRTGSEFEILEMGPSGFVIHCTLPNISPIADYAPHYHVGWSEEFKILSGEAIYTVEGKEQRLKAGDTVTTPDRKKHIHPTNTSSEPLVYEHHATITGHDPRAGHDTMAFFFTMFEWEAAGKIKLDKIGLPSNPLKFAAAGRLLGNAGSYDARMPKGFANFGAATFGRLAEAMGITLIDEKWR